MRKTALICFMLLLLSCCAAAEQKYDLDNAHALLRFTVKMAGLMDVEGRFAEADAAITYNEADLTKSSVTVFIPVSSIDTNEKERDDDLRGSNFFDAQRFPFIRFQSKRIEQRGDAWVVVGDLTMHGVTHEIELPFQWVQKKHADPFGNDRIGFEARTTLKRSDYGVNGPAFWGRVISDEVEILLRVSARIYNWDHISGGGAQGKKSIVAELLPLFEKDAAAGQKRLAEIQSAGGAEFDLGQWQFHVLGRKLYLHGKMKEALFVFQKFTEVHPKSATACDDLADALEATGDRKQAAALYKKALELDPSDAVAAENLRTLVP